MTFFCFGVHDNELGDKIERSQNDSTSTIIAVISWSLERSGIVECDRGKYGGPQVSRQNFLIYGKTLNSFHNTLLFRAKFLIL